MNKTETYIKELEDLQTYTESENFKVDEYLLKAYDLYKNGNYLMMSIIGDFSKLMYESTKDNSYLDLGLGVYELGPTNVLDLDFDDQMKYELNKGEYYAFYARNVNPEYTKKAEACLSYYGNVMSDGKHLRAKALLNKPKDGSDDPLAASMYKTYLLEYFSYGNGLTDEELQTVGIPSEYLEKTVEELHELEKENKDNNEALKAIYYTLLNKDDASAVNKLAKIDNTFISDYYVSKKYPFGNPLLNAKLEKTKSTTNTKKEVTKVSTLTTKLDLVYLLVAFLALVSLVSPLVIIAEQGMTLRGVNVLVGDNGAFKFSFVCLLVYLVTVGGSVVSFVTRKKNNKVLNIVLGVVTAISGILFMNPKPLLSLASQGLFGELFARTIVRATGMATFVGLVCLVSGAYSLYKAFKKK